MRKLIDSENAISSLRSKMIGEALYDSGVAMAIRTIDSMPLAKQEDLSCDGCKFCGQFEYQFPCKVCIRREKDYYARSDK